MGTVRAGLAGPSFAGRWPPPSHERRPASAFAYGGASPGVALGTGSCRSLAAPVAAIFVAEAGRVAAHCWSPARRQRWPEQGFASLSADVGVLRTALGPRALGRKAGGAPGAGGASCAGSLGRDSSFPGRLGTAVVLGLGIAFLSSQINNPVVPLMFSSLTKIGRLGGDEPKCG